MDRRAEIIMEYLPVGHKRPIGLKQLSSITRINQRELRDIIHDLIVNHGAPIGSSSDALAGGYFIIKDWEDLEVATRHLKPRATKIFNRVRALERIARERFNRQLKLVFEE